MESTTATTTAQQPTEQQREANQVRFETELEFIQCLANPFYLQSLAQQDLLSSETFINYLVYLRYFTQPHYARFLQYPQALHHLHLLTSPESGAAFRKALKEQPLLAQDLAGKQVGHWAGWREGLVAGRGGENEGEGKGVKGVKGKVQGEISAA